MNKLLGAGLVGIGIAPLGFGASSMVQAGSGSKATPARPDCPWPAELGAVRAAPGNHKVLLENERARVLDVTVAPGEREAVHAHCLPSVMYLMQEGIYRDYDANGRVVEAAKEPLPASRFPMTLWLEPRLPTPYTTSTGSLRASSGSSLSSEVPRNVEVTRRLSTHCGHS